MEIFFVKFKILYIIKKNFVMDHQIKKCSDFLVEQEFSRIYKKIGLLKEDIESFNVGKIDRKNFRTQKREIIDISVNSIEEIKKETDEKRKEIINSFRKQQIESQSEEEFQEIGRKTSEVLDDIDLEGEKKAADIVWEILPKKTDSPEVSVEKIKTTYNIFDKLSKKAKGFLLTTCIGLIGWSYASSLFSKKEDAKEMLDQVKKAGVSFDKEVEYDAPPILKIGQIGAGGSIGEIPNVSDDEKSVDIVPEVIFNQDILKQYNAKKLEFAKKYKVVDPSSIGTGKHFDASKTVFTSCDFPFPISYNSTTAKHLRNENSVDIIGKYLKELDNYATNKKTGLKLLALSMTVMEGYKKGTESYKTNNPGNIDNTDSGHQKIYGTLADGISDQIKYLESAAAGNNLYPIGKVKSEPPYNSRQLGRYTPGFVFIYEGTLEQFIKVYATGPRINNNYMNLILTFFKTYFPEANVNPKTKIKDIINLGTNEKLIDLLERNNPGIKKDIAKQMIKHKKSFIEVISYTGLSTEELTNIINPKKKK
jgi:hypothetical protein